MRASRRVVTVVFADLVGFTSLSERLDAEDVAAIQQAYFSSARECLLRHGGMVEKYIGDAVVGSFGVVRARDDDAEQATRAALDIVAAVERIREASALGESELQVRVGVNTGEVLITGGGVSDWQLTGDVVNVAARLQAQARPQSVLVGSDTALAVEAAMVLEPIGPVAVKGKAKPIDVWQVVAPRSAPLRRTTLLGQAPVTLGRETELAALLEGWRAALSEPVNWLVTAPPGVGKSRLVSELATRVQAEGGVVWATRAAPGDGTGYGCVADLLRQSLGPAGSSSEVGSEISARLLREGASDLRALVSADHVRALLGGEELSDDPEDLFSSWLTVLEAHESPTPPVWVVEDLHQAGPDLLEFLRFACSGPDRSGRLLVLTSRPTSDVDELSRIPTLQALHLDPLSDEATVAIIEAMLGAGTIPQPVVHTVADHSRGNPLFVEELIRSWVQAGVLQPSDDAGWLFSGSAEADRLPTTVQSVYLGQLDGLPEDPHQVIHSGSIPGYTFPSTALPVLEVADAATGLQLLTELGLLVGPHEGEADPVSYTYRHGLLREVAYASLSRLDRARLHLRFARWVEANRSGGEADEAVGRHLAAAYDNLPRLADDLEAGLTRDALAEQAGARLENAADLHLTSAPTRAMVLLEQALALCPPDDVALGVRRRLKLGDAQRRAARLEDAMRTFALIGETAPLPAEASALVTAALGYEDALFASRLPREQWGEEGLRLLHRALEASPAGDQRAMLLAAIGRAHIYGGEEQRGRETCAAAVALAGRSGSDRALAYALLASRAGQMSPQFLEDRRETLELAAQAARRAGDTETALEATRLQVVDELVDGDVGASDLARREAERLIEQLRRPLYFWYPPMWRAMRALLDGDPERAAPLVLAFREEGIRWHYRGVLPVHAVQALELLTQQGDPAAAVPLIRQLLPDDPLRWTSVLAAALVRSGEHTEAGDLLGQVLEFGFEEPRDLAWTYLMALRAECASALGDIRAAGEVTRLLGPWRGHTVLVGSGAVCLGAVSHYLGLAARTTGDTAAAAQHFRDAVTLNASMNAHWALQRSRDELDVTLSLLGTVNDRRNS
jgi:class 3 adenylate cyclase